MSILFLAALTRILTVCAEPENLPFSNDRREGFDNQVVELVAREMGVEIEYVWQAPRRRVRKALTEAGCDLAPGLPTGFEGVATSRPYYRSTYVFVVREEERLPVPSFDEPRLREARIGLHLVGNGYSPPAQELAERGMLRNLVGFPLSGEGGRSTASELLSALVDGEVDVAVVWGPIAGYYATKQSMPLSIRPVPQAGPVPFVYSISIGVLSEDPALRAEVDEALELRRREIEALLDRYGVPRVP